MRKHRRSIFAAAVLIVAAAVTTALASPGTFIQVAETMRSTFFGAQPPDSATSITHNSVDSPSNLSSFHFLQPLAPGSGDASKFDASLLNYLTVEVCEISGGSCNVIRTFTSQGSNPDRIRIVGGSYLVNWDSRGTNTTLTRRVRVEVAGLELGSVEIAPGVYAGFGRTWPIRFLIEADPVIRVRVLRSLGKPAGKAAAVLKSEFGLCGPEATALLANDLQPYPSAEIDTAIRGVCQETIIPDTTKIADDETNAALTSFDPGTGRMVFGWRTLLLDALRVGDILAGEINPVAPYGFLRKVTSIQRNAGGSVTINSVQASLTEAVYQGTLDASGELLPDDEVSAAAIPRAYKALAADAEPGSAEAPNTACTQSSGSGYSFECTVDETLDINTPGGEFTGTGHVRVAGRVYFSAGYDIGVGVELCSRVPIPACMDRFEARLRVRQKSEVHVSGTLDATLQKEIVITRKIFSPIWLQIGPLPVFIVPVANLVVGTRGDAHIQFTFDVMDEAGFAVGAKWTDPGDGGRGWENVSEKLSLDGQADATLEGWINLIGYYKGNGKLLLYGVAGPSFGGVLGGRVFAQIPRDPRWTIYAHLAGDLAFEVSIIDVITLSRHSFDYFVIAEPPLAHAPNAPPRFTFVRGDIIPANIGTPVSLGLYFNVIDPEGEIPVVTAASDREGPIPLNVTFDSPGLRHITITARDSHGATATATLRINIPNVLPTVEVREVTVMNYTVPQGVQYTLSATAYDPDTRTFLGCNAFNVQVSGPHTVTGGPCRPTIRFTQQQGTRTVTFTATDPHGGVGAASVTVNVTAPPVNLPPEDLRLHVYAHRGPFAFPCEDPNYICELPNTYEPVLYNGFPNILVPPQIGEYYPPLYFAAEATDPEGDPISINFTCMTGPNPGVMEWSAEYGLPLCRPVPSNVFPVVVKAIISDGHSTREIQQNFRMFASPN